MFSTRKIRTVLCFFTFVLYIGCCVAKNDVYLTVMRAKDGDIFTRSVANENDNHCDRWSTSNHSIFSRENCTLRCKCQTTHKTFSLNWERCVNETDLLRLENCSNGLLLPNSGRPLYDLSKPGKAEVTLSDSQFMPNQTTWRISSVQYFNGMKRDELRDWTTVFNFSAVLNNTFILSWNPRNLPSLSDLQPHGSLIKLHLICNNMTSHVQNSCLVLKTRGTLLKNTTSVSENEHREVRHGCLDNPKKRAARAMLLYILIAVGCACVLIAILIAFFACVSRRRRLQRRSIQRNSSRNAAGSRKALKTRSVTKNNGPTTPAIHDVIFNELSWDGDGGFSNRALAEPKGFDADYGIPVDFGTLPRPQSLTSFDSNRNSLSPLTDLGEQRNR